MKYFLIVCACLFSTQALAISWGDNCKYSKEIDQQLELADSETLAVFARAGDLKIEGSTDSTARIRGKACAKKEEHLENALVNTRGGNNAELRVDLVPNSNSRIDLQLTVPHSIALTVKDSSGDITITDVAAVTVTDSSGDVMIKRISGDLLVKSDSSGDLEGSDIEGSVRIVKDSSGDIEFEDVGQDFIVEKDSSGDIAANRVGGDFKVLRDGSGSVDASNVSGEVLIED